MNFEGKGWTGGEGKSNRGAFNGMDRVAPWSAEARPFHSSFFLALPFLIRNMKHHLIMVAAGAAAYYLLYQYVMKTSDDDPTGFVQLSEGFGLDDIVLGGGTVLVASMISKFAH